MKKNFLFLLLLLAGCSTPSSIINAPKLKPENIKMPNFKSLEYKSMRVEVRDERNDAYKKESPQTIYNIKTSLEWAFDKKGISISEASPNNLVIRFKEKILDDQPKNEIPRCVSLAAKLQIGQVYTINSDSFGCYEYREVAGVKLDTDISRSYQYALNDLLKNLDQKLSELVSK